MSSSREYEPSGSAGPRRRPRVLRYYLLALLAFGGVAAYGIIDRKEGEADLKRWTEAQAIPSVDLVSPQHATGGVALDLPAAVEAFYTAPIHARVSGYVKMWYFDIGAHVKAGQILARIDTPDLDQQYEQAKGELSRAQADYNLAELTAERWKALRASQAVSQQTADEKAGDAAARKAQVAAAQANVDRVKAMEDFKNIVAPFDGVITARRIDVGALVSATNTNSNLALFDVADTRKMRVYVRVPQFQAASMHAGLSVTLTLPQYPGRRFAGTIDTTSNAISDTARALLVEAIFPNPEGLLTPGAYAEAHFHLPLDPHKLAVPSSALIFRDSGPQVAVVRDDRVSLQTIDILQDTGTQLEVASGLAIGDRIVDNPSDSLQNGEQVRVEKVDGKVPSGDAGAGTRHEASR